MRASCGPKVQYCNFASVPSATWPSWCQTGGSLGVWVYTDSDVFLCQRGAHSCSLDKFYRHERGKVRSGCHADTVISCSWVGSGRMAQIFNRVH